MLLDVIRILLPTIMGIPMKTVNAINRYIIMIDNNKEVNISIELNGNNKLYLTTNL